MAKKSVGLDTPFKTGEKVRIIRDLPGLAEGRTGKVRLSNGIGVWRRYWVRFDDGELQGQVSHDALVRPDHVDLWHEREKQRAEDALRSESETEQAAEATSDAGSNGSGGGLAAQIPEAILQRSREAKARLLG